MLSALLITTDQTIFGDYTNDGSIEWDRNVYPKGTTNCFQMEPIGQAANKDGPIPMSSAKPLDVLDEPGHGEEIAWACCDVSATANLKNKTETPQIELTDFDSPRDFKQSWSLPEPGDYRCRTPGCGF